MNIYLTLKAMADETRIKIIDLLLRHNYCVRALAKKLELTEPTISQHLKVLRQAGIIVGKKHGYYMHYDVVRPMLHSLSESIQTMATTERHNCTEENGSCAGLEKATCHTSGKCRNNATKLCHGAPQDNTKEK